MARLSLGSGKEDAGLGVILDPMIDHLSAATFFGSTDKSNPPSRDGEPQNWDL
jgi:hypothetical protein